MPLASVTYSLSRWSCNTLMRLDAGGDPAVKILLVSCMGRIFKALINLVIEALKKIFTCSDNVLRRGENQSLIRMSMANNSHVYCPWLLSSPWGSPPPEKTMDRGSSYHDTRQNQFAGKNPELKRKFIASKNFCPNRYCTHFFPSFLLSHIYIRT